MGSYIEQYYNALESGQIKACNKIKRQLKQFVDDIHNPKTFEFLQIDGTYRKETFIFDEDRANEPIDFIETFCVQSKAPFAGQPIRLLLFQKAIIQAVYGFVSELTGYRRYKEVLLEIARKNGKSTLIAGLSAYHLICEKGISILNCANTMKQANIVFEETKNFILQSPILSKRCKKRKSDLYVPSTFSSMLPLANNAQNLDGYNGDVVLLDEIAGFTSTAMYDILKQSQGSKLEPLVFMFSSGGFVRDNFFDDKLDYANNVLDGIVEDYSFISFLYELDDIEDEKEVEKQVNDFTCWIKTNPALGEFRSFDEFNEQAQKAKVDKTYKPTLMAKYFNLPQSGVTGWLSFEDFNNTELFDIEEFKGQYFLGGFDLSEVGDLTCGTMFFMNKGSLKKYIHQMYWMPENVVEEKVRTDKVPYDKWIEQGWIRTSQGYKVDVQDVWNWFVETVQEYDLYPQWQGLDRWGASELEKKMKEAGVETEAVIQGAKTFSAPMKSLKAEFQDKNIIYNNNPVLKWCLANTKVETDKNSNIRPVKGKNQRKRIDGMVSLLDSYVVYCNHKQDFENML